MTYALRGCSRALLAGSKSALASCSQVAAGGDRWLLMAVRGHLRGTRPQCVGQVLGGTVLSNDLPLPAVVNTPTAGSGEDTRTSTRTPSSGMPANGFQERPWRAQEEGEGGRSPGVGVVLAQDA